MTDLWHVTNKIDEGNKTIFNLMEDIRCLKEDIDELKGAIREHNQEVNTMCGMGSLCGRDRTKVRACPACPRDYQIILEGK